MTPSDTMLLAYVDGELDAAGVREIEQLLATDPQARRTVEMYRETAALLRAACGETVYATDTARLLPSVLPRPWPRRRLVWAAAACLALGMAAGAGGTWLGTRQSAMAALIDEIAEYHALYSRESGHLVEMPAAQAQAFVAWLDKRLHRHLEIPDLSAEGLSFAGGRMLVVNGSPVAQLMYTRAQGLPVALCISQLAGGSRPLQVERHDDLRVAAWQRDGYAYVVVGEMPASLAREIAERVRTQLHA